MNASRSYQVTLKKSAFSGAVKFYCTTKCFYGSTKERSANGLTFWPANMWLPDRQIPLRRSERHWGGRRVPFFIFILVHCGSWTYAIFIDSPCLSLQLSFIPLLPLYLSLSLYVCECGVSKCLLVNYRTDKDHSERKSVEKKFFSIFLIWDELKSRMDTVRWHRKIMDGKTSKKGVESRKM